MNEDHRTALQLINQGYAVISRKYGIVARVDREDWKEFSETKNRPVNADYYRRVLSKDRMELPKSVWQKMPNSRDAMYSWGAKR